MKTLFRYLENGQAFEIIGHDGVEKMTKRAPNKNFPTTCDECDGVQHANAISKGVTLKEATPLNFVHCCPNDYVFVK